MFRKTFGKQSSVLYELSARVYETWKQYPWIIKTFSCKHEICEKKLVFWSPNFIALHIFNSLQTCRLYKIIINLVIVKVLNDTAIPNFKIQITEIPLEKKLNTVSPHFPLHAVEEVIEHLGLRHPIIFDVYNFCHYYHSNKLLSFNVSVERHVQVFRNTIQIYRSKKRPFSQGFSIKECDWVQQKIISYCNFPAQEFECMVCCPMLCDKLCVVHWLLSKYHKYYCENKLWSIL